MKSKIRATLTTLGLAAIFLLLVAASLEDGGGKNNQRWVAPKSAKSLKNPFKGNSKIAKFGEKLYVQQCATCHGESGTGDGPSGKFLAKHPQNFTKAQFQNQTDGEIFWKITNGNPPMPTFKNVLSDKQRWMIVNYLRTFASK